MNTDIPDDQSRKIRAYAAAIILATGFYLPTCACAADILGVPAGQDYSAGGSSRFVDLSLLVAEGYPSTYANGFPRFRLVHSQVVGTESAYNVDTLTIDGNTGTQMDTPAHSVALPELKLANSGPYGNEFTDRVPAWKFVGEACVVDIQDLLDQAPAGVSPLVSKERVVAWEEAHRTFQPGDVVLFHSGYSDRYYRRLPEGRRFLADPLEGRVSAWPGPHPETMEYLAATRQVYHIACDSPTMGPMPDLAEATHYAALQHGAVFTEGATGLGELPVTGAFYCMMGPKHRDGPYGEGRAFAIVGNPLAARLIESARAKRVVDLSVVNSIDHPVTWPGSGIDRHYQPYTKNDFTWSENLKLYHHGHTMDSGAGTHLVTPSYALPPLRIDPSGYEPKIGAWRKEYESKYGRLGVSNTTTEKVPLDQTCGWLRVIDVSGLVGTIPKSAWPASPEVTVEMIKHYESTKGELKANEIVVFRSGHTDRTFKPFAQGRACIAGPLAGESEGWPAIGADAVAYLAQKGIRCVGTDGPTLGGVDEKQALLTYWALGSHDMVGVEFLTNLGALPDRAFFLFAPVKIQGCHSAPGRAIALH
jgi:kynurenine formamidase